jgi:hypothetical protein
MEKAQPHLPEAAIPSDRLNRRDVLKLFGLSAFWLMLSSCGLNPDENLPPVETPQLPQPTSLNLEKVPSPTPTPTQPVDILSPAFMDSFETPDTAIQPPLTLTQEPPTPEPTAIPVQELYRKYLPEGTQLEFSFGPISLQHNFNFIIPASSNRLPLMFGGKQELVRESRVMPVLEGKSWPAIKDVVTAFNNSRYQSKDHYLISFQTNIDNHPFVQGHSGYVSGQPMFFEALRSAQLEDIYYLEQIGGDGQKRQVGVKVVHIVRPHNDEYQGHQQKNLPGLFRAYPDDDQPMFVDLHAIDPQGQPYFPPEARQSHQFTAAACDAESAVLVTFEFLPDSIQEIAENPLSYLIRRLFQHT